MKVEEANAHVVPANVVHAAVPLRISAEEKRREPTNTKNINSNSNRERKRPAANNVMSKNIFQLENGEVPVVDGQTRLSVYLLEVHLVQDPLAWFNTSSLD